MKKFNLKLITPLILTLILQGCMPDSLTKFKKEPPKKVTAAAATATAQPVVDSSGNQIAFDPPTKFFYVSKTDPTFHLTLRTVANISSIVDGSLGDPALRSSFFDRCDLVTTGRDDQTVNLPEGLSLSATTCKFTGAPMSIKTVMTAFCSDSSKLNEADCEIAPLVWSGTTSTCSDLDYQYSTQVACESGFNKWYKVGDPIPYQVRMGYKDADGVPHAIYTTFNLSSLAKLTTLHYSQSDKLLLSATATSSGNFSDIAPLYSSTAAPYTSTTAYNRANTLVDTNGAVGVVKIVDSTGGKIGVNKLMAIKVADTAPFTQYGFISLSGDSSTVGKIFSIDSSTKTLYVENISANNKSFSKNDSITANLTGVGTAYTITDVDDSYIFKATSLDNDSQYYSNEYTLSRSSNVYEVGYAIKPLSPITSEQIDSTNAITYTISPALPNGLTLDSTTGVISGTFSDTLNETLFTITVTNPISSTTKGIYLSAIMAPKDFSLSNKQIIVVSNTAFFKEGEALFQAITPPLTRSVEGKIVKILNGYQMAVETSNGVFVEDGSLDSGSAYFAEKAFIISKDSCVNTDYTTQATCEAASYAWSTGDVYYNIALTTSTTGKYTAGDYVSSTSGTGNGAKGVVAGVGAYSATQDILFVKFLTQTAATISAVKSFYDGDVLIDDVIDTVVLFVENESLKLGGGAGAFSAFDLGSDVISEADLSAYIHKKPDNQTIYVSDIGQNTGATPLTKAAAGNTLSHQESTHDPVGATGDITSVTHDNLFIIERGQASEIVANFTAGNGVIYSIIPSLPSGITLDSKTGKISGSATAAMPRRDFILTVKNFVGSETFVFSLEVRDYFQLTDATGVPSFILHKVGDNQATRKCRINSNDIKNTSPNLKALDIRCFLEAEEEDLYFNSLKLSASTGPGFCNYIQYVPYYFNQYSPVQSDGITSKYKTRNTVATGCAETGQLPTVDLCESYHSQDLNCDEGSLEYIEKNYILTDPLIPASCTLDTTTIKKVDCGGKKANCIAGPITEILSADQLQKGYRSLIYASPSGLTKTWPHSSPFDNNDLTNLRLANYTINNGGCYNTKTDAKAWNDAITVQNPVSEPFAGANPYYTINCLDAAKEIKARIRLTIRDWNQSFRVDSGIDNQNYAGLPVEINKSGTDNFDNPYNNYYDWDDDYTNTSIANYTGGSCGAQTAGNCTGTWLTPVALDQSAADCTAVGGTPTGGTCDDPTYTTKVTCVAAAGAWTDLTVCQFNNQYQCELHGGTWNVGDEDYKFPEDNI